MLEPRSDAPDSSITAFNYLRQGSVAWGYGGRSSLLLLAVIVAVEAHQKAILEAKGRSATG